MPPGLSPIHMLVVLLVALVPVIEASVAQAAPSSAGVLYAMTNQSPNQIVVFARGADGSIHEVQRVNTGGAGSPSNNPPFPQNHLDADNEIKLAQKGTLLFAVNAGDNTVSSFRVGPQGCAGPLAQQGEEEAGPVI